VPPATTHSIDLRVLVVSADGLETDLAAITTHLARLGVPYDTLIAAETPLREWPLCDGDHAFYQAVFLVTSELALVNAATGTWQSAFSPAEWDLLRDYERQFGVRRVMLYTFPSSAWAEHGLVEAGNCNTLDQPVDGWLTDAGRRVFPYLRPDARITFRGAQLYLANLAEGAATVPLVVTDDGYVVVSTRTAEDERETMAVTIANSPELLHSLLLAYGIIRWATKGMFIGARYSNLDVQVDDLYLGSHIWDVAAARDDTGSMYRITPDDLRSLVDWQNHLRSQSPVAAAMQLELAFVGVGAAGTPQADDLCAATRKYDRDFGWISHTWDHRPLDDLNFAECVDEIVRNEEFARSAGFSNYHSDAFVQSDVSGLYNADFMRAAAAAGIRYVVSDTSRPGWNATVPDYGRRSEAAPSVLIVGRRPTNLFYSVSTPEEWIGEYNHLYGVDGLWRRSPRDLTYAEILDQESDVILRYLLAWDLNPLMFHQANLRAYDGVHSLLGDLLDATVAKYEQLVNLPIRAWGLHDVGERLAGRSVLAAGEVSATFGPGRELTMTASQPVIVPVTGIRVGEDWEVYGDEVISYIAVEPDRPVKVTLVAAPRSQGA
jgi:hypothetical protein